MYLGEKYVDTYRNLDDWANPHIARREVAIPL
jgi:hypothetical protein